MISTRHALSWFFFSFLLDIVGLMDNQKIFLTSGITDDGVDEEKVKVNMDSFLNPVVVPPLPFPPLPLPSCPLLSPSLLFSSFLLPSSASFHGSERRRGRSVTPDRFSRSRSLCPWLIHGNPSAAIGSVPAAVVPVREQSQTGKRWLPSVAQTGDFQFRPGWDVSPCYVPTYTAVWLRSSSTVLK